MDRTPHSRKLKQELEAALQGWEGKGIPYYCLLSVERGEDDPGHSVGVEGAQT